MYFDPLPKDSLQSIPGSYLLVQFSADNPGYWIWHCHISFDANQGQALVSKVGDKEDWDIPEDFPTC
jgi:L-ascorbate oxidase